MNDDILATVGVIVVNYGSHELVEDNLTQTVGDAFPGYVAVVDSWSSSEERRDVEAMCELHGWHAISPPGNPGFGGGCNLGASAALGAGATALVFVNPDAYLPLDDLRSLAQSVFQDPAQVRAPVVVRPDGSHFASLADLLIERGQTRARFRSPAGPPPGSRPWVSGACFAIAASMWTTIGGFDEDYFLYWEDVDLSRRVVMAGGEPRVDPSCQAVHDEGGTHRGTTPSRAKSPVYYYYNVRGRLTYARKHLGRRDRRRWVLTTPVVAYRVLLEGGRRQLIHPRRTWWPALRGAIDGFRGRTGPRYP